jgi:hypothetical protein
MFEKVGFHRLRKNPDWEREWEGHEFTRADESAPFATPSGLFCREGMLLEFFCRLSQPG